MQASARRARADRAAHRGTGPRAARAGRAPCPRAAEDERARRRTGCSPAGGCGRGDVRADQRAQPARVAGLTMSLGALRRGRNRHGRESALHRAAELGRPSSRHSGCAASTSRSRRSRATAPEARRAVRRRGRSRDRLTRPGTTPRSAERAGGRGRRAPGRRRDLLPYSSGTSGTAKGVELTPSQPGWPTSIQTRRSARRPRARVLAVAPFFHARRLRRDRQRGAARGAAVVTMPRFEIETFLRLVEHHRITATVVVPPIVLALAKHPAVDGYDLSSLEWIGCGAAPLGAELQQACARRLGRPVVQGYGMTEADRGRALWPLDTPVMPGAVGLLLPGAQARIVDPTTGSDLGPGETGELWLRSPPAMVGYLGDARGDRGHRRRRRLAAHRRHRPHRRRRRGVRRRPGQGADQGQGLPGRAGRAGGRAAHPPRRRGRGGRRRRPTTRRRASQGVRRACGRAPSARRASWPMSPSGWPPHKRVRARRVRRRDPEVAGGQVHPSWAPCPVASRGSESQSERRAAPRAHGRRDRRADHPRATGRAASRGDDHAGHHDRRRSRGTGAGASARGSRCSSP